MAYWLVKSEKSVFSIDDLKRDGVTLWTGVRNYQARNFLKSMTKGDEILFYHSVEEPVGIAGLAKLNKEAVPDPTQFDSKSDYFDPKATKDAPRWFCPEVKFVKKFKDILPLASLREEPKLKSMVLLKKGSRLSVQPVTMAEFKTILNLVD